MKENVKTFLENTRNKVQDFKNKFKSTVIKPQDERIVKPPIPKDTKEKILVEFSLTSIFKSTLLILLIIAFSKFIGEISQIIIMLFIALLLSSIFSPTVNYLERKKIPRPLGLIIIYLAALLILGLFISTLIPLVVSQLGELAIRVADIIKNVANNGASDIPFYESLRPYIEPYIKDLLSGENQQVLINNLQSAIKNIAGKLSIFAGNIFVTLAAIFNGILNLVLVLVLTFFLTIEEGNIQNFIKSLFPSKYGEYFVAKTRAISTKTGKWLIGQLTLSLIMGSVTFIGMTIIGIDFALTLGMFSAIAEFIPIIGPFITAIAAILIALNQELWQVIAVIIFFILLQLAEGNIVIPLVMRRAVNLNPVAIILAALIGYQFLGIVGLILAVPCATIVSIFVKDYIDSQK